MPFKSKLRMEHIVGTELFRLTEPLVYETWEGEIRTTPIDFVTDGHSYPKALDTILGNPIASETIEAAVNHDHDCREGVPRRKADREYSQAMSDLGWNFEEQESLKKAISRTFRRKRNWLGVRVGAGWNWVSKLWKN